jgi:hypothetical protein
MKSNVLSLLVLLMLAGQALAYEVQATLTFSDLLSKKKSTYQTDIFGRQIKKILQSKGAGITEAQETFALKLMGQAATIYS